MHFLAKPWLQPTCLASLPKDQLALLTLVSIACNQSPSEVVWSALAIEPAESLQQAKRSAAVQAVQVC